MSKPPILKLNPFAATKVEEDAAHRFNEKQTAAGKGDRHKAWKDLVQVTHPPWELILILT